MPTVLQQLLTPPSLSLRPQMVIQKGNMPTVLQQLLTLPFAHFSDPALTAVLFPTLLACCLENAQTRTILEQELSFQVSELDGRVGRGVGVAAGETPAA